MSQEDFDYSDSPDSCMRTAASLTAYLALMTGGIAIAMHVYDNNISQADNIHALTQTLCCIVPITLLALARLQFRDAQELEDQMSTHSEE